VEVLWKARGLEQKNAGDGAGKTNMLHVSVFVFPPFISQPPFQTPRLSIDALCSDAKRDRSGFFNIPA